MLDFIGQWGGRVETPRAGAERLLRSFREMPDLSAVYTPWMVNEWDQDGTYRPRPLPPDLDAAEEFLAASVLRDDHGQPLLDAGYCPDMLRFSDDETYGKYSVRVGFGAGGMRNHIHLSLAEPSDDPADGPGRAVTEQVVDGCLRALVRAWEPDHLFVGTKTFFRAQGRKPAQVGGGWVTYLRDSLPVDLGLLDPGIRVEHADGGRYLRLDGTPAAPDQGQALTVRRALGYPV